MSSERGGANLLVAALLVMGTVLALLIVDVAHIVREHARLAAAADAAALAAAPLTFAPFGGQNDPTAAAASLAEHNGTRLVECRCVRNRSWSRRQVFVTVAATVDLLILGRRELEVAAGAEFRPVLVGFR